MDRGGWRAAVHGVAKSDPTEVTEHVGTHTNTSAQLGSFQCFPFDRKALSSQSIMATESRNMPLPRPLAEKSQVA